MEDERRAEAEELGAVEELDAREEPLFLPTPIHGIRGQGGAGDGAHFSFVFLF